MDEMIGRGLDAEGFLVREGSLSKVQPEFAPVVDAARAEIGDIFDESRLHSAYLYGSIPRGNAVPGRSDLDLLLVLRGQPTTDDRADAEELEVCLDGEFEQIDGVGVLLFGVDRVLSEFERYDLGWFISCLCTPLLEPDLADELPRYRPSSLLARETNGDLALLLPRWRERAATARTAAEQRKLSRGVARRLVRTGMTLVMPRWGGWTSDLAESAEVFGRYYPERAEQIRTAAAVARMPTADPAVLGMMIEDLTPWLAAEYAVVHGVKAAWP